MARAGLAPMWVDVETGPDGGTRFPGREALDLRVSSTSFGLDVRRSAERDVASAQERLASPEHRPRWGDLDVAPANGRVARASGRPIQGDVEDGSHSTAWHHARA
jgi:hypothetical protein